MMGSITRVTSLELPDIKLIESVEHIDNRGHNIKILSQNDLKVFGINFTPVEILDIYSNKNVLRGLHYQRVYYQSRIINYTKGRLFIVAVNIDCSSAYFGKKCTYVLECKNESVYIPAKYALGTLALEDSEFICMCGEYPFMVEYADGINWYDSRLNIDWPINHKEIVCSDNDGKLHLFDNKKKELCIL